MNPSKIERFKHRRPFRLWICALLSIVIALLVIGGLTALGFGLLKDRVWLWWAIGAFGGFAFISLGFMIGAARVNCRVCTNPLLREKGCNKHRSARRFLGLSYTLGSSIPAVFTGNCRCMYCGEPNFIWVTDRKIRKHAEAKPVSHPTSQPSGFTPIGQQGNLPQSDSNRHMSEATNHPTAAAPLHGSNERRIVVSLSGGKPGNRY